MLILPILMMLIKADYHLNYLKEVYPEYFTWKDSLFSHLTSFPGVPKNKINGAALLFPVYDRYKEKEKSIKTSTLAKRVRLFCIFTWLSLLLSFTYFGGLILLGG